MSRNFTYVDSISFFILILSFNTIKFLKGAVRLYVDPLVRLVLFTDCLNTLKKKAAYSSSVENLLMNLGQ